MSGNYIGMYKMTHYLLEKGHRDIAFVGSVYANENIMDRYYGYRKGLEEAGIPFRKEWVLEDRRSDCRRYGGWNFRINMPTGICVQQ